ncbi:MAG: hypothetical protein QOI10_2252 [Solirubrobacterales bacterium]|jgi:GNAT superfamily N-acetyltransferase|nr:hypothetical protein [Solirubrobacterales bacterium]
MIRHADPSEAEALAALHRSSITAHCSAAYTDAQINAWTAMLRPEAYSALIRDAAVLVVTDDAENRLVGVGVCSPEIGLINATYVERSNTRRGVGRTLMNAMESLLLDAGRREARLDATLNALAFYRSLGYGGEVSAVSRLPSGIELPCVAMSKRL